MTTFDEASEQGRAAAGGAGGATGGDRREREPAKHVPGTGPGKRVTGAGPRATNRSDLGGPAAKHVAERIKPPAHRGEGNTALFAVHEPVVYGDDSLAPFQLGGQLEGQSPFCSVFRALDPIRLRIAVAAPA